MIPNALTNVNELIFVKYYRINVFFLINKHMCFAFKLAVALHLYKYEKYILIDMTEVKQFTLIHNTNFSKRYSKCKFSYCVNSH